jgi:hypothetical protein
MDRYFNVTVGEIRRHDPNHLVSGLRFGLYDDAILAVAAKYCDLLDVHDYSDMPGIARMRATYASLGKPMVLGEFSFTAADSNMPNTHGARAGNPCTTQTQRAAMYEAYATALIQEPFIVGYGERTGQPQVLSSRARTHTHACTPLTSKTPSLASIHLQAGGTS